ncbi:MAG: polyprenyl synthetase family protein [Anaerolineae bacterium]|nr:MAG: polyprenyl synthetase family protein [Anaerolineae bacterium]
MVAANGTSTKAAWLDGLQDDLHLLEGKMLEASSMGHETLDGAVQMIIKAGGKRLRPAITFLVGRLFRANFSPILSVGASVELLHTATLVHDDLIDGAAERRGVPTLHSKMSMGVTVLTGDFLFAKAAALAAEANSVPVVKLFADTLVKICQGEILQARTRWVLPDYDVYIERIYGKTAALFEAAAVSAALIGDATDAQVAAMARYGRNLGLAFQIVDDALDFVSTSENLGKPAGNDMRQGILNLPAMYYVEQGYISDADLLERLESKDETEKLVREMRASGMVEQSLEVAQSYARKAADALNILPGGEVLKALDAVTSYAVARTI